MSRVTVLIPTVGRPSLEAALLSVRESFTTQRVIVLAQRDTAAAEAIFDAVNPNVLMDGKPTWEFHALADTEGGYGHDSRNFAIDHLLVDGDTIASLDDDDVFLPGALGLFDEAAASDAPVSVFKARWGAGHPAHGVTLWEWPVVSRGNIATPMIVWRRCAARYGVSYYGDFELARALLDAYSSDTWAWREEIVCEVRPIAAYTT